MNGTLKHLGCAIGLAGLALVAKATVGEAAGPPLFTSVGGMTMARSGGTLTLLCDGRVLATGGAGTSAPSLFNAELYDPATRTWTPTSPMHVARSAHSATLLPDCEVLVAGGGGADARATAELFDPITGLWSDTGRLNVGRYFHTASLLPTGSVLLAGGVAPGGGNATGTTSAEVYSPQTKTFSPTAPLTIGRYAHKAVTLADRRVLVAGGSSAGGAGGAAAASAEIYDPITGRWSMTGAMATGRWQDFALTLLSTGKVLATGGVTDWTSIATSGAEVFDPDTGGWAVTTPMPTTRKGHSATLLSDGAVLVAGGNEHAVAFGPGTPLASGLLYGPSASSWTPTTNAMVGVRQNHGAERLPNGDVLLAGGDTGSMVLATSDIYGSGIAPPVNRPPIVVLPPIPPPTEGDVVDWPISASDPDGDVLSFVATGLPPGLNIDPGTGRITGRIGKAGAYDVAITVSDGHGSVGLHLAVIVRTLNHPPVMSNPGDRIDNEGDAVSFAPIITAVASAAPF